MDGWTGKRLRVFLSEGKIVKEDYPEQLRLNFWGEQGTGAKVLFDELKSGIDPLSSENIFIVGAGPLNGTIIPCSGRYSITTKSPLTGGYGEGSGGGEFAPTLKFAGYDQIIIHGKSPKPVYLWINNDQVELKDASHLWGCDTWDTNYRLKNELRDPGVQSLCIGPAGENLVRIAVVVTSLCRTAGRGGLGAVMGSKNLKAIAVRGTGSIKMAKPKEAFDASLYMYKKILDSPYLQMFMKNGTLHLSRLTGSLGFITTRNAQQGNFEGWENITAEAFLKQWGTKHEACFACPISCGHFFTVKEGPYACHGKSPEFGSIAKFTSMIGSSNMAAALYANTLCNKMGVDAISCGNIIALAMEAWQRKMITFKDTDSLDLVWGNVDAAIELITKIAYRQGFGNILADGSRAVAKSINGLEQYLNEVKNLDWISAFPGPNSEKGRMLALATSTRGADHLKGYINEMLGHPKVQETLGENLFREMQDPNSYLGKGALLALENNFRASVDSLGLCWFPTEVTKAGGVTHDDLAKVFSAVTGIELSSEDFLKTGERSYSVQRAFNTREGWSRGDDTIPKRFWSNPGADKHSAGVNPIEFQKMLDEYYKFHGWDDQGIPTKSKLGELGLSYIADQIKSK